MALISPDGYYSSALNLVFPLKSHLVHFRFETFAAFPEHPTSHYFECFSLTQSIPTWIDLYSNTPDIFSGLFLFGEQRFFGSFKFIRLKWNIHICSFWERAVLWQQKQNLWSQRSRFDTFLWNLLCNLASRRFMKIFCFPPFWAF